VSRLLLSSAAVLAVLLSVPSAEAQMFRRLAGSISDPVPPLGRAIDEALREHSVGGVPLGEYLPALQFTGCLDDVRAELVEGLGALRRVHVNAVERRRLPQVWRTWERKLSDLSPDAWLLTTAWLDSPEVARRLYMCDDGLPPSWKALDPDGYVREAVVWFDVAVAEREQAVLKGAPADRELAIMELLELQEALVDRFATTYPAEAAYAGARERLDERLDLMWRVLVEPHHYGFTPRARTTDPETTGDAHRRRMPQSPFIGISIPDPQDSRARDRVVESWRRQRRIVDAEIKVRTAELEEITTEMATARGEELQDLVRAAARLEAQVSNARVDLVRMQNRVRHFSTGKPWIDSMLSAGFRRRNVKKLDARDDTLEAQSVALREAVEEAVSRGASPPPRWDGTEGGGGEEAVAATRVERGTPGPGNWLAGLPEGTVSAAVPDAAPGIPEGTGAVERVYEGPLPLPSAVWSLDLVDELVAAHPTLDRTDVRILLGLVKAAYRELPDRAAVEEAVRRTLDEGGLRIRGEESTLSDLWIPGRTRGDQPVVTFVLTLNF